MFGKFGNVASFADGRTPLWSGKLVPKLKKKIDVKEFLNIYIIGKFDLKCIIWSKSWFLIYFYL